MYMHICNNPLEDINTYCLRNKKLFCWSKMELHKNKKTHILYVIIEQFLTVHKKDHSAAAKEIINLD